MLHTIQELMRQRDRAALHVWKVLDPGLSYRPRRLSSAAKEYHRHRYLAAAVAAVILFFLCVWEARSSWLESSVLPSLVRSEIYVLQSGPSNELARPLSGPYDARLGAAHLSFLIDRLKAEGYQIANQARDSRLTQVLSAIGIQPVYSEKDQAGIRILDRDGQPLYQSLYPRQVYRDFQSVPPLVAQTLLFIENRQMLDASHQRRNPAIQWGRLSRAMVDLAIHEIDHSHPLIGGSTLATQLTKIRHSPGGRTGSVVEKARQVASASLEAYEYGPHTLRAQQQIICSYLNSIPLAATRDDGEVIGLEDGLRIWYGADPAAVNRLLSEQSDRLSRAQQRARATAYREALALLLALHAPTRELVNDRAALNARTDRYLRALAERGIISPRLRDLALRAHPRLRSPASADKTHRFFAEKGSDAIRSELLAELGLDNMYALDRLDLNVHTTLDKSSQESVSSFLNGLSDVNTVKTAGLSGDQLLGRGKPGSVIYSVTLYERGEGANMLRVQTDNYNQPLDISHGTRLQLGSTAKLRTLINYLQIIEELHQHYAVKTAAQLKSVPVTPGDKLTPWALSYLSTATDRGLEPMLDAALGRKYSASPGEAFFTAGGLHHFVNFDRSEDSRIFTVADAFQNSVNLAFIRLMRDIERYYMFRVPGASPSVLSNANDPARRRYLARFADYEGRTFLREFYERHAQQKPDQALGSLLQRTRLTPLRAAVIYRSVRPQASFDQFEAFLVKHIPAPVLARQDLRKLYSYGPEKLNLNDRGYLAHVHPLELWLLNFRERHRNTTLAEVFDHSAAQRQEVYSWLFKSRYKHAQDKRIETLLELDAFNEIHAAWKKLGYPFDSLTPSYATCIGVSGDTPQSLADLTGIILNGGMRLPTLRIQQIGFLQKTPFETVMAPRLQSPVRVLSPSIAKLVRQQMIGVVQRGTGRRASAGLKLRDGTVLAIGGKTGTGDNRLEEFSAHGGVIASHVVNRTAAFVFFIGDRFYGTILAFVPGQSASNYKFTSALAVQLLKDLEPRLEPLASSATSFRKSHRGRV